MTPSRRLEVLDGQRQARHAAVSRALDRLDGQQLRALLDHGVQLGRGIGGTTLKVDVEGAPVFVKCMCLTDLERSAEHWASTANYLDLPPFCHYGIGSPGFGIWRELAMLAKTTEAVLGGRAEMFPLTHHWRVLTDMVIEPSAELSDTAAVVAYWEHSPAVQARLEALRGASAVVAVFQEYIPHNLHQWLTAQVELGDEAVDAALRMVEAGLHSGVAWMNANGWLHLDAHFENIQTDGKSLYFADFGLAMANDFQLSPAERAFAGAHASYDLSYVFTHFIRWLVTTFCGVHAGERDAVITAAAHGVVPECLPPYAAALVIRYAPVATVVMPFYRRLQSQSRRAPYPSLAAEQALDQVLGPAR